MSRLEDFATLIAIVEKGSLTAAANHVGRSLQAVSRVLASMEQELGVELVRRTTRRSIPTESGLVFYRRIKSALSEIEEAKLEASKERREPSGLLRISVSAAFAPIYVVPAIAEFLTAHPKVEVDIDMSDRYVDLVEEGFDLAVRIGEMPDSPLKARRLADLRRVIFASPGYFKMNGRPKRPEDLERHQCIVRTAARERDMWPFTINGRGKAIKVAGRFRASGAASANEAAVCGLGIASAPLWQVRALVDQGLLELILTRFEPSPVPIHAVWAATKVPPAKTQAFVDLLATRLRTAGL